MSQPYVGEVRMFGGNFAPVGWAFCNGQPMSISEYEVLYSLIGTTYGGNGTTTFNLPNLQGRLCVGMGQGLGLSNYVIGQAGGTETVTLTTAQMPVHNHPLSATTTPANQASPTTTSLTAADASGTHTYTSTPPAPVTGNFIASAVSNTGGNQPHTNLMPSLCVSFIIALLGVYPSQ